jgi:hypothetical protein
MGTDGDVGDTGGDFYAGEIAGEGLIALSRCRFSLGEAVAKRLMESLGGTKEPHPPSAFAKATADGPPSPGERGRTALRSHPPINNSDACNATFTHGDNARADFLVSRVGQIGIAGGG